ncbi:RICIN domain-containing protein [Streptomyces sp. NPDC046727]|uniref:RICIN domain-containing protein n=1 Tax=Streptomyces sp. NPDC046727 TaxID=3155373 RepID=UPI003411BEDA
MNTVRLRRIFGVAASTILAGVTLAQPAHAESSWGLVNTSTNKCADLPGFYATGPNTGVSQYTCNLTDSDNQRWFMRPTRPPVAGYSVVEFVNVKSGLCMDLPGYGSVAATTRVSTFYCNSVPDNDNQEWVLEDGVGPSNTYFHIVNYKSGLCLDVAGWVSDGSDLANDLPLTVYPCYNAAWANNGWDDHTWHAV